MWNHAKKSNVVRGLIGSLVLLAVLTLSMRYQNVIYANSGGSVTYYDLTLCSPTGGSITNDPAGTTFVEDTVVTLTAVPNAGYAFDEWTGAASGSVNPTTVTMSADRSVCATFIVDNTAPVITLLGSATVTVECGASYTDAGATASDNNDGDITAQIAVGGDTVDADTPGVYVITYDVSDAAQNNATQVTRTVTVSDTTAPVITLLGDNPMDTALGGSFVDPGVSAADACDGDLSGAVVVGGDTVDSNTVGAYVITYDVEDGASNEAIQQTRTVNVKDLTPPVIVLVGDDPLDINLGGTYSDPGATASDNVDGVLTGSIVVAGDTVDTATAGVYNVTYNVTDAAGNDATEAVRVVRIWPSLTLSLTGNGGTAPAHDTAHYYAPGSEVEIAAIPGNADSLFDGWTGDAVADSQSADTTVIMNGPKAVTANFVAGYELTSTVASGAGSISRAPDAPIYKSGAQVVCVAVPDNGYEFDHWVTNGNVVSGTVNDAEITVQMDADTSLAAHFNQLSYTLSVSTTGNGSASPTTGSYHYGDPVTVTATPDSGWYFAYWTGGLSGFENPKSFSVTESVTATAVFVESFSLTVLTQGSGSVSPGSGTYIPGAPVQLTATATSGWRFDHWEGDLDSQENPFDFSMRDHYTLTAVFVEDNFITIGTIGNGSVTRDPVQPVNGYTNGASVDLTAVPDSGWLFEGWSGALGGNTNPETVIIPVGSEIVAEFREAQRLELDIVGSGEGTVQVSDANRTYTPEVDGSYTVPLGTVLTLTATASDGCFYLWEGDSTGFDNPTTVEVLGDLDVTAKFAARSIIEVFPVGTGTITFDPVQPVDGYCPGTEIQVTAVPGADWVFTKWGGTLLNLEWSPTQTYRTTPGRVQVTPFFSERPGIDALQMVDDLGAYLVATGVYTSPTEVENYDYDFGEMELDSALDTVYIANGIPDAAELMALEVILQDPSIEYKGGGVSHMALWQIYQANLAQAQSDLSAESGAIQRAVAAYMTLGTFGHCGKVAADVLTHFSVALDLALYRNAGDRWFGADKDMDGDGITNRAEWDYALDQASASKSVSGGAAAGAFSSAASDEGDAGGNGLPADGGAIEDFANDCAKLAKLNVQAVGGIHPWHNLKVEARVVTPDGSASFVIGEGDEASFPVGTEVHVKATNEDWFLSWMAEGSLLHGSAAANDSFMLTQDTTVIGVAKGAQSLNYQHTNSNRVVVSVAGGDAPLELNRGVSSPTRRYITVRGGTALSLTAESNNPSGTGLRVYGEYSQTSTNALSSSSVMTVAAPYVAISGGAAPYGTGTVMGTMANGQAVVAMGDLEIPITMDRLVYPLPNPTTAPWTKWTEFQWLPDPGFYVYSVTSPDATDQNPNPTGSAETRPMKILTLNDAECLWGCEFNNHGTVDITNAKRYYVGPTATRSNGEFVKISAKADAFHETKGFKISGEDNVYTSSQEVTDFYDDAGMNLVQPDDGVYYGQEFYYIEMKSNFSVTPIYTLTTPIVSVAKGNTGPCIIQTVGADFTVTNNVDCLGYEVSVDCIGLPAIPPLPASSAWIFAYNGQEFGRCSMLYGENKMLLEYLGVPGVDKFVAWAGFHAVNDNPCMPGVSGADEDDDGKVDWISKFTEFHPWSQETNSGEIASGSFTCKSVERPGSPITKVPTVNSVQLEYVLPQHRPEWQD